MVQVNFPTIATDDRLIAAQQAAQSSQAIVLLKGARTIIADPQGNLRCNHRGTTGLARGGSGDVLTGLIAGLVSQARESERLAMVAAAAWWHGYTGTELATARSLLGIDPQTLAMSLIPALQAHLLAIAKKSL